MLAILVLLGFVAERFVKKTEEAKFAQYGKVGLVKVTGLIVDSFDYIKKIREFVRDDRINSIVIRIDSPGGAVGPSQELYHFIRSVKTKPIVASMGSVAASGGLYVALGAQKIFAQPGTITGSIGVIMQIPNVYELANKIGVKFEVIKSGDLKDVGNIFRPMTEEEKEFLGRSIHKVHGQFIRDISAARQIPLEKVYEFADGRFLTGEEALELGLIDNIGDILEAAKASLELAGIKNKEPLLVVPKDYSDLIREIIGMSIKTVLDISSVPGFLAKSVHSN
ncbi:MAG: signal peptide peptidase SppA [Deltaproteobacteria bacterium]|nr:signal peptide peptidase SppA [Deltaproteobacteria bacterium]